MNGKSIKLFLAEGSIDGILTAEIINWTGYVLSAPRTKLSSFMQRDECSKSGVYFLVGYEPDKSLPIVYIGESDNICVRLKQHNYTEESGGKDFWDRVCVVTSKDQNITKTHIKYLESRLINIAKSNGQCELSNVTSHVYDKLPESDIADMEHFLEQMQVVLPAIGFTFLKEKKHHVTKIKNEKIEQNNEPIFYLSVNGINAKAQNIDGVFYVLKDSQVTKQIKDENHTYTKNLRPQLFKNGIINSKTFLFTQDYEFSSPSAAGSVILGRSCNGKKEWKIEGSKKTYGEWLQSVVEKNEKQHV